MFGLDITVHPSCWTPLNTLALSVFMLATESEPAIKKCYLCYKSQAGDGDAEPDVNVTVTIPSRARRRVHLPDTPVTGQSPARRRRLRDLPVRRATAAAAAAPLTTAVIAPAATPGPAASLIASCPVCLEGQADTAVIPCGHCTCSRCMNLLMSNNTERSVSHKCPVCRAPVRDIMRLHFSM